MADVRLHEHAGVFLPLAAGSPGSPGVRLAGISSHLYRTNKFIVAQSLEKAPDSSAHSGVNTRPGAQLTLNFKNLAAVKTVHVVLHYDQILNVSAAGAEVLD